MHPAVVVGFRGYGRSGRLAAENLPGDVCRGLHDRRLSVERRRSAQPALVVVR